MADGKTELDPRVATVRNVLNLDDDEDDALLSAYVASADAFVRGSITDDDEFYTSDDAIKSLFDLAVTSLAGTYYQQRLAISQTQAYQVDLTTRSVIAQLRGRYSVYADCKDGDDDHGN